MQSLLPPPPPILLIIHKNSLCVGGGGGSVGGWRCGCVKTFVMCHAYMYVCVGVFAIDGRLCVCVCVWVASSLLKVMPNNVNIYYLRARHMTQIHHGDEIRYTHTSERYATELYRYRYCVHLYRCVTGKNSSMGLLWSLVATFTKR